MTLNDAAKIFLATGLCVLPARRAQKRPAVGSWKQYSTRLPTTDEVSTWFANRPDAVCVVCGQVSGNLEILDFDAGGALYPAWTERIPSELRDRLVIEKTPSGGYHAVYRCQTPVCGNLKLAQRRDGDKTVTLIETRGEGGLFLCAPTPGYELVQGDLTALPVLTEAERDALLMAAWDLNEYLPAVVNGPPSLAHNAHIAGFSADNSHNGTSRPHNFENGASRSHNSDSGHSRSHNPHNGPDSASSVSQAGCASDPSQRPGDDYNVRGDVRGLLAQHGWSLARSGENEHWRRPGKTSGWSATLKDRVFYVFSANAAPFEPSRAYSPFAVYTLLTCGGDYEAAARSLRMSGYGGDSRSDIRTGVDLSGILGENGRCAPHHSHSDALSADHSHNDGSEADDSDNAERPPDIPDPGPMPAEMLRIPGFISEVMDHSLAIAPYPSLSMAFSGALVLQAFLGGRKVRDPGDNRTNIYLLGLAHSSAGKDKPREVNTEIIHSIGMSSCLGKDFASGEGIQDALLRTPCMLFQTDEIDGMLQSINKARDGRYEVVMGTLLTMYSSARSVYPMRRKAGKDNPGVIDQPNLIIFGTAIPNHYYQALSERMLTNGLFARMLILEAGPRGPGQEPRIGVLPQRVLDTAKWWADFRPGPGNLENWHPVPVVIEQTPDARNHLIETREAAEAEYAKAESQSDPVGTTVWGRVSEQVRKLALLYAISENHLAPSIGLAAVEWASAFVLHQTRRMLFMAAAHVAENEFDALLKRATRYIREWREKRGGDELMPVNELRRRMKQRPRDFEDILREMLEQGIARFGEKPGKTKPKTGLYLP